MPFAFLKVTSKSRKTYYLDAFEYYTGLGNASENALGRPNAP